MIHIPIKCVGKFKIYCTFARGYCGNSAFNVATMGGHIKTMKLLLTVYPYFLNMACNTGASYPLFITKPIIIESAIISIIIKFDN